MIINLILAVSSAIEFIFGVDPPASATPARNQLIDVVRALLAWTVVLVHVAWVNGIQGGTQHDIGVMAVQGFVILSGFVITQLILTKRETYGTFIWRRFMRLFPVFLVCLLFSLAIHPLTSGVVPGPDQPILERSESQFWWQHFLAHLTLLYGLIPSHWLPMSQLTFLGPAWSITLEWQLYLLAPLLIWWLSRSGLRGAVLVLVPSLLLVFSPISSVIGAYWGGAGGFFPQKFIFFLLGALGYLSFSKGPRGTALYSYPTWLTRAGEVSYSTYLIHYPILALITRFVPRDWPPFSKAAIVFSLGAPIILVLSFILYRHIEQPGIALGKKLQNMQITKQQLIVLATELGCQISPSEITMPSGHSINLDPSLDGYGDSEAVLIQEAYHRLKGGLAEV